MHLMCTALHCTLHLMFTALHCTALWGLECVNPVWFKWLQPSAPDYIQGEIMVPQDCVLSPDQICLAKDEIMDPKDSSCQAWIDRK